jgi:hypothetical protein
MAESGVAPKSLDQILATRAASVQDRWFARLYLLKPVAILGLALAVIVPSAGRLPVLLGFVSGSVGGHAMPLAAATNALAVLAGLSLLVRPAARCALLVLLVLTLWQLVVWFRPSIPFFWSLNAVTFWLPMLLAVLFTLGILDDR